MSTAFVKGLQGDHPKKSLVIDQWGALVDFKRVTLKPGEQRTVRIPLKASQLAYWSVQRKAFEVEPVPVMLMVGASSADIKLERTLPVLAAGKGTR